MPTAAEGLAALYLNKALEYAQMADDELARVEASGVRKGAIVRRQRKNTGRAMHALSDARGEI